MTVETPIVVAIDGPAGVGKSTAARLVASRLGVPYLDTGAMYRSLTLRVLRDGVDLEDAAAVEHSVTEAVLDLELDGQDGRRADRGREVRLVLDGDVVDAAIRSEAVSRAVSKVSSYPAVRQRLVELQRQFGHRYGGVIEGRDIGSVVFPETPYKFYLDADPGTRAERRFLELRARGETSQRQAVAADLESRDRQDRGRALAPLTRTPDHRNLDTTHLSIEQVVATILQAIEEQVS
jgi:cytidylate kinase